MVEGCTASLKVAVTAVFADTYEAFGVGVSPVTIAPCGEDDVDPVVG